MILLTGATGFVGSHLSQALAEKNYKVRALVRKTANTQKLQALGFEIAYGDVTESASLLAALKDIDNVIHLVAIIEEKKGATFEKINWRGTENVVEAAKEVGVKKFIHMGALGTGPFEKYPYSYTKWQGQQAVEKSGLDYTVLRPSIIFGEGDGFVTVLAKVIKRAPVVPVIGAGKTRFQPIWVGDIVRCVLEILKNGRFSKRVIDVGGARILSYEEIVDEIMKALSVKRVKLHLPPGLAKLGAKTLKSLGLPVPVTPEQIDLLELDNVAEPNSVERWFGFKPKALEAEHIRYVR